uniref:Putative secreted protein n=1 Tax=Anopheles darlingi TaxID=43151 RepID=A0A2M4DQ43_ANODA
MGLWLALVRAPALSSAASLPPLLYLLPWCASSRFFRTHAHHLLMLLLKTAQEASRRSTVDPSSFRCPFFRRFVGLLRCFPGTADRSTTSV